MKPRKKPKKISPSYLENSGLYYLQRFSASTKHFEFIMQRKIDKSLKEHGIPDRVQCIEWLKTVTQKFQDYGYLDDKKFARSLIRTYRAKGLSSFKISQKLREKKLDHHTIQAALKESQESSSQNLDLLAALRLCKRKKIGAFLSKDKEADLKKDLSKLAYAGHSYDICSKALNMSLDEAEELLLNL